MNRRRWLTWLALMLATWFSVLSCTPTSLPPEATNASRALIVSAAASVQDAMKAVQIAYAKENPDIPLTYNFGSSGSLAQQIAQGAPVDVFLSASLRWMDDLETQGQLLEGSRRALLQNSLVLIADQDNSAIQDFFDLDTEAVSKIAIGEPNSVPAGRYAEEVLTSLDLFATLQPKLVFAKDVRQVLSYVATGNVDVGVVYATDTQISDQVQVLATAPAASHSPIIYPVAVVEDSANTTVAQDFVAFLSTEPAIAIFESYGFSVIR